MGGKTPRLRVGRHAKGGGRGKGRWQREPGSRFGSSGDTVSGAPLPTGTTVKSQTPYRNAIPDNTLLLLGSPTANVCTQPTDTMDPLVFKIHLLAVLIYGHILLKVRGVLNLLMGNHQKRA